LTISLSILAFTIACNSSDAKIVEWQLLFDEESLDGWNVVKRKEKQAGKKIYWQNIWIFRLPKNKHKKFIF